jgi:hypothetical protein
MNTQSSIPAFTPSCSKCNAMFVETFITLPCGHKTCLSCMNMTVSRLDNVRCLSNECSQVINKHSILNYVNDNSDEMLCKLTKLMNKLSNPNTSRLNPPIVKKGYGFRATIEEQKIFENNGISVTMTKNVSIHNYYLFSLNTENGTIYFGKLINTTTNTFVFEPVGVLNRFSGQGYWATPCNREYNRNSIIECHHLTIA